MDNRSVKVVCEYCGSGEERKVRFKVVCGLSEIQDLVEIGRYPTKKRLILHLRCNLAQLHKAIL